MRGRFVRDGKSPPARLTFLRDARLYIRLSGRFMKYLNSVLLVALAALCFGSRATAWDETGHRQVADLAWARLNEKARAEITAILMAGDPKFRPVSGSEADVRDAFRKAATFPDVIKGNKETQYEAIIEPMNLTFFVTRPPDPKDNEDVRCKTWHYYDVPIRDIGNHVPKESNALKALAKARYEIEALEDAPTPDRKMQCWWLNWIAHLVGDLHQPLHCVSNHEVLPEGDAGGNLFTLKIPGSTRPGRLHGSWDGGITRAITTEKGAGASANAEDVSQRWSKEFAPAASDAVNVDAAAWVRSGASLADTIVYVGIERDQEPTAGYEQLQQSLCKRQAVLAGARLAAILNAAIGK
jgi:hypothetical protein